MKTLQLDRRIALIASENTDRCDLLEQWIRDRFSLTVYKAGDYTDCVQKLRNVPPHVLITDVKLPKAKSGEILHYALRDPSLKSMSIIVIGELPETEPHLDELISGRVCFIDEASEEPFLRCLKRALDFVSGNEISGFFMRYLEPGALLMREGDPANQVYLLKKGRLRVTQTLPSGGKKELGEVEPGEFVGELAYFSAENRSATVEALTHCELIEIPMPTFEKIFTQRPAWAKKMLETLSKRLIRATQPRS